MFYYTPREEVVVLASGSKVVCCIQLWGWGGHSLCFHHSLFWSNHYETGHGLYKFTAWNAVILCYFDDKKVNLVTCYCSGGCYEIQSRHFPTFSLNFYYFLLSRDSGYSCYFCYTLEALCVCWEGEKELLTVWTHGGVGQDNANPVCKLWGEGLHTHARTHAHSRSWVGHLSWSSLLIICCHKKSQLNKTWVSSESSWPTLLQHQPIDVRHSYGGLWFKFDLRWVVIRWGVCRHVPTFL